MSFLYIIICDSYCKSFFTRFISSLIYQNFLISWLCFYISAAALYLLHLFSSVGSTDISRKRNHSILRSNIHRKWLDQIPSKLAWLFELIDQELSGNERRRWGNYVSARRQRFCSRGRSVRSSASYVHTRLSDLSTSSLAANTTPSLRVTLVSWSIAETLMSR